MFEKIHVTVQTQEHVYNNKPKKVNKQTKMSTPMNDDH